MTLLLLVLLLIGCETTASAYTDPGSGILLWQVLVGGFFGLLYYFRKLKHRLLGSRNLAQKDE
jgi:hypothetical protein